MKSSLLETNGNKEKYETQKIRITDLYAHINEYEKYYQSRTTFVKIRMVIYLQIPTVFWMYMGLMMLGRPKYIQLSHQYLSLALRRLILLLKSWKDINNHVLIKFRKNSSKHRVMWSTNFLIIFWIRKNCYKNGRNIWLCVFIRMVIKLTAIIIEEYYSYKLNANVILHYLSRLTQCVDEIIGDDLCAFRWNRSNRLIRYFTFVRYWRKKWSTMD
jgi:hypothetical protein